MAQEYKKGQFQATEYSAHSFKQLADILEKEIDRHITSGEGSHASGNRRAISFQYNGVGRDEIRANPFEVERILIPRYQAAGWNTVTLGRDSEGALNVTVIKIV